MASWYGPPYAGRKAADGTVYDQNAMTAAHLTLPMGTMVRVTNLTNNQSAVVKITDRGPFVHGRIIDLSLAAAKATGVYRAGVAKVKVEAFAAPVRANADPGGHWCVQVGAFARESDAIKLKEEMIRRYATAKVIEFPGSEPITPGGAPAAAAAARLPRNFVPHKQAVQTLIQPDVRHDLLIPQAALPQILEWSPPKIAISKIVPPAPKTTM